MMVGRCRPSRTLDFHFHAHCQRHHFLGVLDRGRFVLARVFFIRAVDVAPPAVAHPEQVVGYINLYGGSVAVMTGLSILSYLALRRFWHRAGRSPGIGYWVVSGFFYFCVMFIPVTGFSAYFAVGACSVLQWVSLALGALFLVLGFPRLPTAPSRSPPPLPS